jgi:N-acyl-D-aspartate/D-glutamate deacylase
MIDTVIRNGFVVDGSGRGSEIADVGIESGRIVEIGRVDAAGSVAIDATGKVVAPGFVDIHTHYDAQVLWDPLLRPSSLHGITTAISGNCGFTIAPLPADTADQSYLMRMLSRVEAMPLESLEAGPPWDWSTFGEFLGRLDGAVGINVGFLVGHSTLRRGVLGADAVLRECTADELTHMQRLLSESLEAGGLGFSSTGNVGHNDAEGRGVPSRYANAEELIGLAGTIRDHEGTVLEWGPRTAGQSPFSPEDIEQMLAMSLAAGRSLNWNLMAISLASRDTAMQQIEACESVRERGGRSVGLTGVPNGVGSRVCLGTGFVFDAFPGWESVMLLPADRKLQILQDEKFRDELKVLAQGEDNHLRGFANWGRHRIYSVFSPENEQFVGRTFGDIAEEQDRDPWDVMWDIAFADKLRTRFGPDGRQPSDEDWAFRVECWREESVIVGGSDAGAHVDMISSFNYPTKLLAETVRVRPFLSIEEAVHLLTDVPARYYGIRERGRLEKGWHADIVVFDPATVDSEVPELTGDLPGNAQRLFAGAIGIEHVLVNGVPVVTDGRSVDGRGGKVLRSGHDTATVPL